MKGWIKYLIGAVLAYGICVLQGGRTLSTEFGIAIQAGLIVGIFLFVVLGPIHFLLQLVGHFIIARLKRPISGRMETTVLNFPALVVFIIVLVSAATPMSPATMRTIFQEHLNNSMPTSVIVKGYRMLRGMNDGSYFFLFSINKSDLDQLLKGQGYVLQDSPLDDAMISHYQQTAQKLTSQPFSLTAPVAVYLSETNIGLSKFQKKIIFSPNQEDVLFIESFF